MTNHIEGNTTGTLVTYASGQPVFHPENSCPQPLSNQTYVYSTMGEPKIPGTNNYQLAVVATSNSHFLLLEDGTQYLYSQPASGPYSSTENNEGVYGDFNGTYGYSFSLFFFHYSDVVRRCFGSVDGFNVTAGIEVDFFAPFQQIVNGTAVPGTWNFNDPSIHTMSSFEIFTEDGCRGY